MVVSNRPPRESSQDGEAKVPGDPSGHPSVLTTHVCWPVVDGRTRTVCSGFPIRKANEDQQPSSPSLSKVSASYRRSLVGMKKEGKGKRDVSKV